MPIELSAARTDLQTRLNDTNAAYYSVESLNTWLNEGCRDAARRAKCLYDTFTINVNEGNQKYPAPVNMVEIHRVEFAPTGSINVYPLEFRNYSEMDSIWGIRQGITQYTAYYWTIWNSPPNTYIMLFPVPAVGGTLKVFFYRQATAAVNDSDYLDVLEGWWDVPILYAQYTALFKNSDPRWSQIRQLYLEQLDALAQVSSGFTDNVGNFSYPLPSWPSWPFGAMDAMG